MGELNTVLLDAIQGAQNAALGVANVQKGESVLIVMHSGSDLRIADAIGIACRGVGAKVDVMVVEGPERGTAVSKAVTQAMAASDVIFLNMLVAHNEARQQGARVVGLYMKDIAGLTSPGARFPAEIVFKICELATEQWKQAKTIKVTCGYGSELSAKIVKPSYVFGHVMAPLGPGEFSNFAGGFGGLGMWPDWSANGVVYFDTVTTFPDRTRQPLKWTVTDGRVTKVEGEDQHVRFFEESFERGGADANHFGEIMIGLCPQARIQFDSMFGGLYLETERHAGVMHCAVGSSVDLYAEDGSPKAASVKPPIHLDCMNLAPTLVVDDVVSIDRGRLTVVDAPEVRELASKYGVDLEMGPQRAISL
jgi:leucyl aminopeptidase (aminopeptidase T)